MFVGYVESRNSDTYHMYLPDLNSIHETRDVQWSKRMYFTLVKDNSIHAVDQQPGCTFKNESKCASMESNAGRSTPSSKRTSKI
jgi:hypothetical protein